MADERTPDRTPELVPQPHGGALYAGGLPGNRGGRPADAFRARLRRLADKGAQALEVKKILDDPDHPLFVRALEWATDHGYGKAVQRVEQSGPDGGPIRVEDARRKVSDRLARLIPVESENGNGSG